MRVETTVGDVIVAFDTEAETLALTIGRIHIALTTEESADLVEALADILDETDEDEDGDEDGDYVTIDFEALSHLDVDQLDEVTEVLSTIRASKVS
jgi:hypothetical protein